MVSRVAVLPNGRLVSGSYDDTIREWDTSTEEYVCLFGQRFDTICQTKLNVESASVVSDLHSFALFNIPASYLTKSPSEIGGVGLVLGTAMGIVHLST